jgi:Flp pilus assembly protein TadD/serine/threonine protein kinase
VQLGTAYVASELTRPGTQPVPGYRLLARVGIGGSGEVWSAEGPGGFYVALKFIRLAQGLGDDELRTLHILRSIRHPNLLSTFGAWRAGDFLVIGTELADQTLWDRFGEAIDDDLPGIPRAELVEALGEAAKGLDYLNEPRHVIDGQGGVRIQHRDFRPQHIMLVGGGVKVADFGMAMLVDQGVASPARGRWAHAYTSPEVFGKQVSAHSDQYSLAVTYCHLATSRLPYPGDAETIRAAQLLGPPDLAMLPSPERPIVARALALDPSERWPSCRAFIEALARSEAGRGPATIVPLAPTTPKGDPEAVSAGESSPTRPVPRRVRPALVAAAVILASTALALRAGYLVPRSAASPRPVRVPPQTQAVAATHEPPTLHRLSLRPPLPPEPEAAPAPPESASPGPEASKAPTGPPVIWETIFGPPGPDPSPISDAPALAPPLDARVEEPKAAPPAEPLPAVNAEEEAPRETKIALELPERVDVVSGRRASLPIRVARDGIAGSVEVRFEGLPQGVAIAGFTIPAGVEVAEAEVEAGSGRAPTEATIRVVGSASTTRAEATTRLAVRPLPAPVHRLRGNDLLARGEYTRAIAAYDEALRADPDDEVALVSQGSAYFKVGDYDRAIAVLSEAIRLCPDDPVALNNRGLAYRSKGDCPKAVADYTEAIRLRPADPIARFNRGLAHTHLGDLAPAIADLDEAIRLDPRYARAYQARGDAHARKGDLARARADHAEAARLDPRAATRPDDARDPQAHHQIRGG